MNALQEISQSIARAAGHAAEWWSTRSVTTRWSVGGVVAGLLAGVLIAVMLSGGGGGSGVVVSPISPSPTPAVAAPSPTGTPTPAATATPSPSAAPEATPTPASTPAATATPTATTTPAATPAATATPAPTSTAAPGPATYYSLDSLREGVGEAPDATLGRLRIPIIDVDAAVGQRLVTGQIMEDPTGPSDVVWYDLSLWENLGGAPGEGHNAVFAGHVDYRAAIPWADASYQGEAVFFNLTLLAPGDRIEVDMGGTTHHYVVTWTREVSRDLEGGWRPILTSEVETDSITLITCGGEFDRSSRTYSHRFIVRAERIEA